MCEKKTGNNTVHSLTNFYSDNYKNFGNMELKLPIALRELVCIQNQTGKNLCLGIIAFELFKNYVE